ncbi:unnamed protein product, partial [Closterium sp. Yama58-4]
MPFCRVVPEPWRTVDNGPDLGIVDLTVTALDGKLDSLKDGPDSSDVIECNSSDSEGTRSDSNRGSDSSDICEHPGNCSTSSRADANGNGAADGTSGGSYANHDGELDAKSEHAPSEPTANECISGESSTNSESAASEAAPSESAASEAAVRLVSAAALVAAGVQDAEEDSCSICLDAFTESEPATLTVCNHEYHFQCVLEWAQRREECPMCWRKLALQDET